MLLVKNFSGSSSDIASARAVWSAISIMVVQYVSRRIRMDDLVLDSSEGQLFGPSILVLDSSDG